MSFDRVQVYSNAPKFGPVGGRLANGGTFGAYTSVEAAISAWVADFQGTQFLWRRGISAIPSTVPGQFTASANIIGPNPAQSYEEQNMGNSFDTNDAFAAAPRIANAVVVTSTPFSTVKNALLQALSDAIGSAGKECLLHEAYVYENAPGSFQVTLLVYPGPAWAIADDPTNTENQFASISAYSLMPKVKKLQVTEEVDSSSATACSNLVLAFTGTPALSLRSNIIKNTSDGRYSAWMIYAVSAEDCYV
jgi:hypothetical protein